MNYEIHVGNIGCVYSGRSKKDAHRVYNDYVVQSAKLHGAAAGEAVVMYADGESENAYLPGNGFIE